MYFNLKLLELPAGERFRTRFEKLLRRFESSDGVIDRFPEFAKSQRYADMQTLISQLEH